GLWVELAEHCGSMAALKRLWPVLFAEAVGLFLEVPEGERVRRFVVSTHALALSTSIEKLAESMTGEQKAALGALANGAEEYDAVTLPKSLMPALYRLPETQRRTLQRLPSLLEARQDEMDGNITLNGKLG